MSLGMCCHCVVAALLFPAALTLTGETEETALIYAQDLVAACQAVHSSVTKLFEGIDMPSSSVWMWPGK